MALPSTNFYQNFKHNCRLGILYRPRIAAMRFITQVLLLYCMFYGTVHGIPRGPKKRTGGLTLDTKSDYGVQDSDENVSNKVEGNAPYKENMVVQNSRVARQSEGEQTDYKSGLQSMLRFFGSMNATIVGIDREVRGLGERIRTIEDEVSDLRLSVRRMAELEPVPKARAEEERRRNLEKEEIRERLILSPRAKLYTGVKYTGNSESYDFKAPLHNGGCYNLATLKGKIKSVDTNGTCVRIFGGSGCSSWSQAIYPGSSLVIDAKLRGVESIGPCVSNEFEHATLTKSGNPPIPTVRKRAEEVAIFANVPDLVRDYYANPSTDRFLNNTEPITHYKLGQGGRLEGVYAVIYSRHILPPDVAKRNRIVGQKQSFIADLGMNGITDEPGYAVPLELGGPAEHAYNVFAQEKGQAVKYRDRLVPTIKQHLAKHRGTYVIFTVALQYRDSASKRPAGIWYWLGKGVTGEVTYGYLPNLQLNMGLRG